MAHPNEPLPLFSPTQVSSGREQVLHSLFSPTLEGGVTSFNKKSKTTNREMQKRERMAHAAKRLVPKTPSSRSKNKENMKINAPLLQSPEDEFYSPVGRNNHAPFIPATISKTGLKTPANLAKSAFRSPLQTAISASSSSPAVSTISALTTTSSCSFKSVPIDMLSFDFVKTCDSPESLQQIVNALSQDGSKHYPSLLRTAKTQLQSIQATRDNVADVPNVRFSDKDNMLYVSSVKDESSLALSLSSSVLDEGNSEHVPATTNDEIPNHTSELKTRKVTMSNAKINHRLSNTAQSENAHFAEREAKLRAEIDRLSNEIHALQNSKKEDDSKMLADIKALKHEKLNAESKVAALQEIVLFSSARVQEANEALANVRDESRLLRDLLESEHTASKCQLEEAKALEASLRRKIQTIASQLKHCKEQNAGMQKSIESRVRNQVERESATRNGEIHSLRQSLQNAQMTLNAMTEERNATLRSIHQALGKSDQGVERLSPMERKATIQSFSKKLSSSRAATKGLSKALMQAEIKQKRANEAELVAKKRLDDAKLRTQRLELENDRLAKEVQKLTDELDRNKAYIDELSKKHNQDEQEWQKKEKEYKATISSLKSQVRNGDATVSLALYRKAVDEARARATECQDKRLEINTMSRKVQALEMRLKEKNPPPKIQTKPTPPSRQNLRKVTPTSSATSMENCDPKTPTAMTKAAQSSRPPPPPPTPRTLALREAGGRAGLCAKLKQMRRSPLAIKK